MDFSLSHRCGKCLSVSHHFEQTIAPFQYQPPISQFIQQLKFYQQLHLARTLGYLLLDELIKKLKSQDLPELIIPVPLHKTRIRQRGFNQAVMITKPIAKYFNIPVAASYCQRVINTTAQSELPANKRLKNIKNAFVVTNSIAAKHIAIVDDVMTTSSTVDELSRVLKKAGVQRIQIWCCARAVN